MDCVVHQFNYEVPYNAKKDIPMRLEYLNGFDDDFEESPDPWTVGQIENDYEEDDDDLDGLDGKEERQAKRAAKKESGKPTLRDRLKKGVHIVNRLNPAAALLRAGVLAAMKVNLMKAAGKLRFSYWTEAEATKNNMEPHKFAQLKSIREKLEKIYYGAGGKPENLKKAILTSRGNRDKRVALNGLGEISYVSMDNDLEQILGFDTYADEFSDVENDSGINGLGSVTAGAAIASATGVIGTIAALIKKLGVLFKKGSPQAEQEILADNTADEDSDISPEQMDKLNKDIADEDITSTANTKRSGTTDLSIRKMDDGSGASNKNAIAKSDGGSDDEDKSDDGKPEEKKGKVMQWISDNKVATALIGAAVVGGIFFAIKAYQKSKVTKAKTINGLDGHYKPKKRAKTKKRTMNTRYGDIPTVELL